MATQHSNNIAATQLLTLGKPYNPRPTNNGARSTRHNTHRSWQAVQQFLASGPQTRQAINNMLTSAYNHGCFVTYLINRGALIPAAAGSAAGPVPLAPTTGINKVARQAVAAGAMAKQANAQNAALIAALTPAQLKKLQKAGVL